MSKFRKTLEERARFLAADKSTGHWDNSIPSMLRREIALTLEQIDQTKFLTKDQMKRLLQLECDINTEILYRKQSIPWYTPAYFQDEQKLKQRLFDIEKQRRDVKTQYNTKKQTLEDKLLNLINKHDQLDI